ncbi:MPN527 family putative ECF transporter permease subunit [Mycoplasma sp. Ms02]|uniref:MPN527 family putative ECF transporter permease subunit n=1 Tax=Mycoplasma sp. Ms02 TaxID=353851 RepID=UPI001C8AFF60|nr:hypothetical protein [Mycoplasma sp. Ms02]QZE12519.1 hypothetical protein K4L35_00810 [Mycoplasma sp. Ms02]
MEKTIFSKQMTIREISFAALILAMTIVLSSITNKFKVSFLSPDFSLVPILFCFLFVSKRSGLLVLVSKFLLGPLISSSAFGLASYFGHFISLISISSFVCFYLLFSKIAKKLNLEKHEYLFIAFFAILYCTALMTILNTFLFNSIYFYLFGFLKTPFLNDLLTNYQKFKGYFFGIDNYYFASFTLYGIFNLANLMIVSWLFYGLYYFNKKTKAFSHLKYKIGDYYEY